MAIGDSIGVHMGTSTTNRQPSSGVEEQISFIAADATTDAMILTDGTSGLTIVPGGGETGTSNNTSVEVDSPTYNMSIMITNSIYLQKAGTTDVIQVSGVQFNS